MSCGGDEKKKAPQYKCVGLKGLCVKIFVMIWNKKKKKSGCISNF